MSINFLGLDLCKYEAAIDPDVLEMLRSEHSEGDLDPLINEILRVFLLRSAIDADS